MTAEFLKKNMEIISLQSEETIPFSKLFGIKGSVRNIVIISAYIDIESINLVIRHLNNYSDSRAKPNLNIYIDKSSSRFFTDRKINKEMRELQKIIQKNFSKESGISLVQFGKLFHSKIYLIEGNKYGKILLGSMNFTQKGLYENEEILLLGNYEISSKSTSSKISKWVKEKYLGELKLKAVSVSEKADVNLPACMRQFLLNGSILYELKEHNPFRFKLNLPEKILKQQVDIDPLLESNVADTISLDILISEPTNDFGKDLPGLGSSRALWKRYCVETCYGFWNPNTWREELDSALKLRVKQRKPYYDAIKSIVKDHPIEIKTSFLNLCERIQNYLIKEKITNWLYGDIEKATEAWDKWYINLQNKLENEKQYDRLISGIASVPAPDVWSDPLSSKEFEESFFESILYHWSKEYSKETTNVIAQAIAYNMDLEAAEKEIMDIESLSKAFDAWFDKHPKDNLVDFAEQN